jgi:hypothetical protein
MANFFFGEGSRMGFNVDLITYVNRDPKRDSVYVYFGKHDSFELKGETARHLIGLLTRLESEADRTWKAAVPANHPKSKKKSPIEVRK